MDDVKIYEDGCDNCIYPGEGPMCPWYGLAPHTHKREIVDGVFRHHGAKDLPKDEWPDNFVECKDEPGMGHYYCTTEGCPNSKEIYLSPLNNQGERQ